MPESTRLNTAFRIAVLPGDGVGQEIMAVCLEALSALERKVGGCKLSMEALSGAMGLPDVRYPDGTEIAPHLEMRREFGLFAGLRPVKPSPMPD